MAFELVAAIACIAIFSFFLYVALPGPNGQVKPFLATELRQSAYSLFMLAFLMVSVVFVLDTVRTVF